MAAAPDTSQPRATLRHGCAWRGLRRLLSPRMTLCLTRCAFASSETGMTQAVRSAWSRIRIEGQHVADKLLSVDGVRLVMTCRPVTMRCESA